MTVIRKGTYWVLPLVFIFCLLEKGNAQSTMGPSLSWETDDSEEIAEDYLNNEITELEDHIIYESKVRLVYEWDEETKKPKAEEEGTISVLALSDYTHYYDGLFQDDDIKVDYAYGVDSKDRSYNLEVFKKSYESSSIFHQDGEFVSFRLPNVPSTRGQIMSYKYQCTFTDLKFLTKTYLQKSHFIKKGVYEVWVPSWMQAEIKDYNLKEYGVSIQIEEGVKWEDEFETNDRANTIYTVYRYIFDELTAKNTEYRSPGSTYYMPHLLFINKRYDYKGDRENIFADVDDLYAWYRSLTISLDATPSDEIKLIVDELTENVTNEKDKLKNIFYWVQDNIRYIAFEDGIAGFRPEDASFVCANRYGDCKGMANLAKVMLQYAGIDARLTWLGTNHIAHSYDVPTLSVDNHMICTVFLDGEQYFIDPTEEYVALGEYATRIQGRNVLIENGDTFLIEKVPEFKAFSNRVIRKKQMAIIEGKLKGKAHEAHNGESKLSIIRGYNLLKKQDKEDAIISFLNDDNKNLKVVDVETPDLSDRESAVEFSYNFIIENNVIRFDNTIMFQPDFNQEFYYFIFEDRKTPYQFNSKYYLESEVSVDVPNGFTVKHLPDDLELEFDGFSFKLDFKLEEDKIIYTKKIVFEKTLLTKNQFEAWNSAITELQAVYDDYVILKDNSL